MRRTGRRYRLPRAQSTASERSGADRDRRGPQPCAPPRVRLQASRGPRVAACTVGRAPSPGRHVGVVRCPDRALNRPHRLWSSTVVGGWRSDVLVPGQATFAPLVDRHRRSTDSDVQVWRLLASECATTAHDPRGPPVGGGRTLAAAGLAPVQASRMRVSTPEEPPRGGHRPEGETGCGISSCAATEPGRTSHSTAT
jgi:hypothetical protein